MRINAGKWKGRPIGAVDGLSTRPTPDIIKQAVFNIIRDKVEDAVFCDIFAGTGSMAFEALSRGAKHAYLIENGKAALSVIKKNADYLGCTDSVTVVEQDVYIALKRLSGKVFDIIFIDAPYNKGFENAVLSAVMQNKLINDTGIVIVQFEAKNSIKNDIPDSFEVIDERKYGRSALLFLKPVSVS